MEQAKIMMTLSKNQWANIHWFGGFNNFQELGSTWFNHLKDMDYDQWNEPESIAVDKSVIFVSW